MYVRLNVEPYGGMLMAPWFDRPLSVAGRVIVREKGEIRQILVDMNEDMALIPSLAIHMNRDINGGYHYNVQKDMLPLYSGNGEKGNFMRMLAEEDYETRVREMGAYFLEGLRELKSRYAIIGDVDGLGLALRAEICAADGFTPDKAMMDRIVDEGIKGDLMVDGKRYGLVLDVGGYYKNVITLAPSLNITREEVDLAMRLLDEILRRVTKN